MHADPKVCPITPAQLGAIKARAAHLFSRHSSEADLRNMTGKPLEELTRAEASALLTRLQAVERGGDAFRRYPRRSMRNGPRA